MKAVELDWNPASQKVIIVLGDAPPLDIHRNGAVFSITEHPMVGVFHIDRQIRVIQRGDHLIKGILGIRFRIQRRGITGTSASDSAADYFTQIAEQTGGAYTGVDDASKVSDAIMDSIEQIEMKPVGNATVSFGDGQHRRDGRGLSGWCVPV